MPSPEITDAPIVPYAPARQTDDGATELASTGELAPFDRPPETDHATPYTRDDEEIEPFVADLR